ncbi:MAG: bifunctional adenosylcobinamide kinase/adenosylcobinamide-phosphate guanylyltransferase [Lachnospiraceae bacterium]|nr:bifunctional adenosylcobinamide kinase/adenosylcobinamide-phosphate guanylyltransferase [Lachnospiraceae bacterium]
MNIFIYGPNGSGKSRFAEELVSKYVSYDRYYIATLKPYDEEGFEKVRKHVEMRKDLNMTTLEDPYLADSIAHIKEGRKAACVLLEDLSNLTANVFFETPDTERILPRIHELQQISETTIIVSIGGLDPEQYDGETKEYIRLLNRLNSKLAAECDEVYEFTADGQYKTKSSTRFT